MDWYLSGDDPADVGSLRRHVRDYLTRHAAPDADVAAAELVVNELVANAVEHATGPVWVRLSWGGPEPDLEVWDLGPGFVPPPLEPADGGRGPDDVPDRDGEGGRGLFLVSRLGSSLEVQARRGGGSRVAVRLPVQRAQSRAVDAVPVTMPTLPEADEAAADGSFGRESFLRALVVQLAQTVEHVQGPQVAEELVAAVGSAVGGQLEQAYRAARAITGRMTPEQVADCLVRLKRAIDGDFEIVEAGPQRIVLVARTCPFGPVVRRAPTLCRMTSSVFGGIAARNAPDPSAGAAVVLEERIAVGDPECRIVVHLGAPPAEAERFAHPYRSHEVAPGARPGT